MVKVSLMVAMSSNRVIGKDNDIPWRIPRDWQYVKKTTFGHPIILGRKNSESIGKPLCGRRNIVLTRKEGYSIEGCEMAHSTDDVFKLCKDETEIFIFGGEEIYKLFLPFVEKLYITKIHHHFDGDTFFPDLNDEDWNEVSVEKGIQDENNPYSYCFHVYERKITDKLQ